MKSKLPIDREQAALGAFDDVAADLAKRPGFLLRRCLQNSAAIFEQASGDLDITPRQYDYLYVLNQTGEIGQGELGALLGLDRSTNTLVLKILERKGWIERAVVSSDTRRRRIRLSAAGREIYQRARKAARSAQAAIAASLPPEELQVLLALLSKVIRGTTHFLDEGKNC